MQFKQISAVSLVNNSIFLYALSDEGEILVLKAHAANPESGEWYKLKIDESKIK